MLLVNTLLFVYFSSVLYLTLMPFIDIFMWRGDFLRQIVLNVIMTMPFGFLFPLTRDGAAKFSRTIFSCFLMGLGIELLQPLGFREALIKSFPRSSDVTDLFTNVVDRKASRRGRPEGPSLRLIYGQYRYRAGDSIT